MEASKRAGQPECRVEHAIRRPPRIGSHANEEESRDRLGAKIQRLCSGTGVWQIK